MLSCMAGGPHAWRAAASSSRKKQVEAGGGAPKVLRSPPAAKMAYPSDTATGAEGAGCHVLSALLPKPVEPLQLQLRSAKLRPKRGRVVQLKLASIVPRPENSIAQCAAL